MAPQTTIGLLLSRLNAGYAMDVLTGAHALARQRGARLIAVWGTPRDILASPLARAQIDGWMAVFNIPTLIQEFQYRRILRLIRSAAADPQLEERP